MRTLRLTRHELDALDRAATACGLDRWAYLRRQAARRRKEALCRAQGWALSEVELPSDDVLTALLARLTGARAGRR